MVRGKQIVEGAAQSANTPESAGAMALLAPVLPHFTWLRKLWVDGGYTGADCAAWIKTQRPKLKVEVIKRSDDVCGFKVLPIRNGFYNWSKGEALLFDDTFNHEVWNDTDGYRVVLFIDFARPLRQPVHWLNNAFLNMSAFAPFLREAGVKQKKWEKKFYKG